MDQSLETVMRSFGPSQQLAATIHRAIGYATAQQHRAVTLEHLLLSLTEDPDAGAVLHISNIDLQKLKTDVGGYLGALNERVPPGTGGYEPAPHADLIRIFQVAAAAAQQKKRAPTGGLILAAIIGDGRTPAANMLRVQGLTFEEAVKALQHANGAASAPAGGAPPQVVAPQPAPRPAAQAPAAPPRQGQGQVPPQPRPAPQPAPQRTAPPPAPAPAPSPQPPAMPQASAAPPLRPPAGAAVQPPPAARPPQPAPPAPATLPIGAAQAVAADPGPAREPLSRIARHEPRAVAAANAERAAAPDPGQRAPAAVRATPPPPSLGAAVPTARPAIHPHRAIPPNRIPSPQPVQQQAYAPEPSLPPPGAAQHGSPPQGARPEPSLSLEAERAPQPQAKPPQRRPAQQAPAPQPAGAPRGIPLDRAQFARPGQLTQAIPQRMRQGVSELIEVRIARHDIEMVEGHPPTNDARGGRRDFSVAKAMTMRLRSADGAFYVETDGPETQWIENRLGLLTDDYVIWRWAVTPRDPGTCMLQLNVSLRTVSSDGAATETALPDERIDVKVTRDRSGYAGRIFGWLVAMGLGAAAAFFGADALAWALQMLAAS